MDEQRKRLTQIIGNANTKLRQEFLYVVGQERIEKIADYLLANGVLVPPCRVWDVVYRHQKYFNDATLMSEIKIKPCRVVSANSEYVITDDNVWMQFSDFGRTVFLTREEAEAALAERQTKEKE